MKNRHKLNLKLVMQMATYFILLMNQIFKKCNNVVVLQL